VRMCSINLSKKQPRTTGATSCGLQVAMLSQRPPFLVLSFLPYLPPAMCVPAPLKLFGKNALNRHLLNRRLFHFAKILYRVWTLNTLKHGWKNLGFLEKVFSYLVFFSAIYVFKVFLGFNVRTPDTKLWHKNSRGISHTRYTLPPAT